MRSPKCRNVIKQHTSQIYIFQIVQHTLLAPFSLSSKGLHTGLELTATFLAAPAGHGIQIQRVDLPGEPVVAALAENVIDTSRGTVVALPGDPSVRVSTIEHAMAALFACGIDNCLIQIDGPEFPILDGSSRFYIQQIHRVGLLEQDEPRNYLDITEAVEYRDDTTGSWLRIEPPVAEAPVPGPTPAGFSVESTIYFDNSELITTQTAHLDNLGCFATDFASARTFVFVREIAPLLQMGLIRGGDLSNALVIYDRIMPQPQLDALADTLGVEHRDATHLGFLQLRPLQWENEPARHKLLDILGDMALVGRPIRGRLVAYKPGHTVNNKFARLLRQL